MSSPYAYVAAQDARIAAMSSGIAFASPRHSLRIAAHSGLGHVVRRMGEKGIATEGWIDDTVPDMFGDVELSLVYRDLTLMVGHGLLDVCCVARDSGPALAQLSAISPRFRFRRHLHRLDGTEWVLSRFALLRRIGDAVCLESPTSMARLSFAEPWTLALLHGLREPTTPARLASATRAPVEEVRSVLALLCSGDFVHPVDNGTNVEDDDPALRQWEFHDLLFHTRSRMGRHSQPVGGNYRFLGRIPPLPAVKDAPATPRTSLPVPDLDAVRNRDPALTSVIEARRSGREYGRTSIGLGELGEFLWRLARVEAVYTYGDRGELSKRPYPSGGASYELEIYLTVDRCVGVAPGFYWYHPTEHSLALVRPYDGETEKLIAAASTAMAGIARPQVLLSVAARFQRVSWKYDSIAYSVILKNVGVLYAYMYLIGSAMGLSVCALGTGDSDQFADVARTDYLVETSVGEFALGPGPDPA